MKQFKVTTDAGYGRGRHHHVVFLNEEGGYALCSTDKNHTHTITFQPEIPPQPEGIDPQTGQPIPAQPGQPEQWIVEPALDGHTHDGIVDPEIEKQDSDESDETVVSDVKELFRTAREIEAKSLENARESEEFYAGEQWDKAEKLRLEGLQRAAVTINQIERNIDQVCGTQRQERTDIKFVPTEQGDQRVADMLNVLVKNITNQCYFPREESKAFEDAAIGGRGLFNLWVDVSNDIRGEIKIEKFPYTDCVFGPHEKEDLSDCEYLVKHRWFSLAKLKQLWPDKTEDISQDYELASSSEPHLSVSPDQYESPRASSSILGPDVMIDIATKQYRVLECWRRVYTKGSVLAVPEEDFYFPAHTWKQADLKSARTIDPRRVFVIEKPIARMRITKIAGGVVLSDENPADLPDDDFYIVPVYAKKRGNRFWGKVESSKDPQRYVNKNYSQAMDVGNKMASYGWFYDSGTFPEAEKEKFKRVSTSPGFVVEVNNVAALPQKVEGSKFPSELVQLMELGKTQVSDQMNIITNPNGANESGNLFLQRHNQKLLGSEYLFDNLSFAKQKLGRLIIKLIQRYYKPQRIVRILRNAHAKQPVEVQGQNLTEFTDDEIQDLLEGTDLGAYDVEVTESQWSPSMRLSTFMMLSDMQKNGAPIPPEAMFEFADMPDDVKQKLTQMIAAQQQAQADGQSQSADMEIQKTLIAQGYIPPAVEQKYLQPQQPQQDSGQGDGAPVEPPQMPTGMM